MNANTSRKQSSPILPNQLRVGAHTLNRAGPGRSPGSVLYLDLARGKTVELHVIHIISTGERYSLAAVSGNSAVNRLHLPHPIPGAQAPVVGNVYLAQLAWAADAAPTVNQLWPLIEHPVPKPAPTPQAPRPAAPSQQIAGAERNTGVLVTVVGDKAWVREERTGRVIYLEPRHLLENIAWKEGTRVSYERVSIDSQWIAQAVLAA